MIKWLKYRANEKSTWMGVVGFIGTMAALPVVDTKTIIINACAAITGVLAGADTSKGD